MASHWALFIEEELGHESSLDLCNGRRIRRVRLGILVELVFSQEQQQEVLREALHPEMEQRQARRGQRPLQQVEITQKILVVEKRPQSEALDTEVLQEGLQESKMLWQVVQTGSLQQVQEEQQVLQRRLQEQEMLRLVVQTATLPEVQALPAERAGLPGHHAVD
ncbi:MAG: hypothetical protein AB7N71_09830 [Phycisphaerae bacterium]